MYKLYTITKEKSKIRGFWRDENGKIYIDKIKIENCENSNVLNNKIKALFSQGEKAVFYSMLENFAFIQNQNYDIPLEFLRHKITWQEKKLRPSLVKALLVQHGGFTVYKNEKGFLIELFKA